MLLSSKADTLIANGKISLVLYSVPVNLSKAAYQNNGKSTILRDIIIFCFIMVSLVTIQNQLRNLPVKIKALLKHIEAFFLGSAFIAVGSYHFINQEFFEAIVPLWFPYASFANLFSGGAEIIVGIVLFLPKYRPIAAGGLLLLLIAVYPANIDMFINDVDVKLGSSGEYERIVNVEGVRLRNFMRLPFQFVFAWLVWRHTKEVKF